MNWRVKAAVLTTLSILPFGRWAYRRLQSFAGTARLDIEDHYRRKFAVIRQLQTHLENLENRSILEVGTGWHPVLPLLLSMAGAKSVTTIDLNPWLTKESLRETVRALQTLDGRNELDLGISSPRIREFLHQMTERLRTPADIRDLLSFARIRYIVPVNAGATPFPSDSFDAVVSTNLLEHLPPVVLERFHEEEFRILRAGGVTVHNVNPGDHYATDRGVTSANFIRFSPLAWYFMGGFGIAYHNRLRCIDYPQRIRNAGFTISRFETHLDQRALEAVQSGTLVPHPRFSKYSPTQLAEDVVMLVSQKP